MGAVHRIRRLRLRVKAPSRLEASAVRLRVRELLRDVILPSLERSFDAMDPGPDAIVRIPHAELLVTTRLLEEGGDALSRGIEHAVARVPAHAATDDREQVLRGYLVTGAFAWHADAIQLRTRLRAEPTLQEELTRIAVQMLASAPSLAFITLFRALQVMPDTAWVAVARATGAAAPAVHAVASLAEQRGLSRDTRLRLAAAIAATSLPPLEVPAAVVAFSGAPPALTDLPQPVAEIVATAEGASPLAQLARHWRSPAKGEPPNHPATSSGASLHDVVTTDEPVVSARAEKRTPQAGKASPVAWMRAAVPPMRPDVARVADDSAALFRPRPTDPLGVPAPCAGLILLHPFLVRFFDRCGLRVDDASRPRAAALLYACAMDDEEPIEHDLAFIKVLLGLSPDEPLLLGDGLLSEIDRAEVEGLLRAVIDHWTALKKTSPQGLQRTFLRRPGLIREDTHGYRLQIDGSAFDVLIAQLPWGFGVVKLPWMRQAIVTEWEAR